MCYLAKVDHAGSIPAIRSKRNGDVNSITTLSGGDTETGWKHINSAGAGAE